LRLLDCAPVIVNFAGRIVETVGLSLCHSCKSPIKRQGITLSNLIDLSVSQSSTLMPLHSTHDYQPCWGYL